MLSLGTFIYKKHNYEVIRYFDDQERVWFSVRKDDEPFIQAPISFIKYCDMALLDDPKDKMFFEAIKSIITDNF